LPDPTSKKKKKKKRAGGEAQLISPEFKPQYNKKKKKEKEKPSRHIIITSLNKST
jgi:hypothetical protein